MCLLDYDFRGPSLHIMFRVQPKRWINDFLDGECGLDDALTKIPEEQNGGQLFVGCANPVSEAMRYMMTRDKKWEAKALNRILSAKRELFEERGLDALIFDTSPGMQYSSINAVATSDVVLLVMKYDDFDIEGTRELVTGITDVLGRRTGIILNRVVAAGCGGPIPGNEATPVIQQVSNKLERPVIGLVPCLWELQRQGSKELYASSHPQHSFVKVLENMMTQIEQMHSGGPGSGS